MTLITIFNILLLAGSVALWVQTYRRGRRDLAEMVKYAGAACRAAKEAKEKADEAVRKNMEALAKHARRFSLVTPFPDGSYEKGPDDFDWDRDVGKERTPMIGYIDVTRGPTKYTFKVDISWQTGPNIKGHLDIALRLDEVVKDRVAVRPGSYYIEVPSDVIDEAKAQLTTHVRYER